ncbi:hypothetical protein [Aliidiomarina sp.]|uniref:hypothetical protein n=1 Tax=Aliidiomarina sp. TaxID=1872439 RepID=UPI003A4E297F
MFKKWRRVLVFLILFITMNSVGAEENSDKNTIEIVSILKIIASPERYLGRELRVVGYLSDMHLFAYKTDSDIARMEHAILLPLFEQAPWEEVESCMNHYAIVTGTLVDTELMMANITSIRIREEGRGYRGCYKWTASESHYH